MMGDRQAALRRVAVGDMFHASIRGRTDGSSHPCLTLQVREDAIFARRVTTQSVR